MKLGKNMQIIIWLVIIESIVIYYANLSMERGGNFSNGFLVGWLYGIVFCLALAILFFFIRMVYLNWSVRWKKKK